MLRCSEKAFTKCPDQLLCGSIADSIFAEDSECAAFNRAVEDKPMTNADRIRDMSGSELAELLTNAAAGGCPPDMDWDCAKDIDGWDACEACWERWLQQPYERVGMI